MTQELLPQAGAPYYGLSVGANKSVKIKSELSWSRTLELFNRTLKS